MLYFVLYGLEKPIIYASNCVSKTGCTDFCSNAVMGRSKKVREISDISKSRLRYDIEPVV